MTDYEYLLICTIMIPIVAFMIGRLWEHADDQLVKEEKTHDEKCMHCTNRKRGSRFQGIA